MTMTPERLRAIAEAEAREHLCDYWRLNIVEMYGDELTDAEIDEVVRMIREDARIMPGTPSRQVETVGPYWPEDEDMPDLPDGTDVVRVVGPWEEAE